jgi:c-di-GMP-binding flagellar brake protein YcgR
MTGVEDDARPALHDLVDVLLDSATEPVVATVSAIVDEVVQIDAPLDHSGRRVLPMPSEGGLMVWRGARDMQQAPITVLEAERSPSPAWRVRLAGPGVRCQRRSFVRADVNLPVVLRHGEDLYEITALDLSEGGMRGHSRELLPLMSGEPVTVEFTMDGSGVAQPARLARVRHGIAGQSVDLGIAFTDMDIRKADRMRRFVFDQLREHRSRS